MTDLSVTDAEGLIPSSFHYEGKLPLQQPCTVRWPSGIFRLSCDPVDEVAFTSIPSPNMRNG